jgi:hypothetical protein
LYLEGPDDWPALARLEDGWTFAFAGGMALAPAIVPA